MMSAMLSTTHTTRTVPVLLVTPARTSMVRWLLSLGCGHQVWVVRANRPTRKRAWCEVCAKAARENG